MESGVDARLALVFDLLRSLMQSPSGADMPGGAGAWGFVPPPGLPSEEMSATDLLNWWFRPLSAAANPWDDYLGKSLHTTPLAPSWPAAPASGAWQAGAPPTPPPGPSSPWLDLEMFAGTPEEQFADEHSAAAVDCLYAFAHALGRRDVEMAMSCIAADYHVFADDGETDRLGVRQQIESLLDSLRGWDMEVSIADIPVPVFYQERILIYVEFQIEAYRPEDDLRRLLVDHRVVLFEQEGAKREWLISAMSPVKPR